MFTISVTSATGLGLTAVVDKVTTSGAITDPALRWDTEEESFRDPVDIIAGNEIIDLVEDATLTGYYTVEIDQIDGLTENLRVIVFESDTAIGVTYNIPVSVNPEYTIDFSVQESR